MNYTLMPSLEHRALVNIVIFHFDSFPPGNSLSDWQVMEEKVMEKISLLPNALKKKVLNFIKPIRMEVVYWKKYHTENFRIPVPNKLCWTPQGTVDKKKTAEILIKDEEIDIATRYRLACLYCLENNIRKLWNKMPEDLRSRFYSERQLPMSYVEQLDIVIFWTYYIMENLPRLKTEYEITWRKSLYPHAFESATFHGNKAGTEYFLQKLTLEEKEESLVKYAGTAAVRRFSSDFKSFDFPNQHYTEILCFLLSQLNEQQQMEVFKLHPHEVLKCFLDWPWQSFFVETATHIRDYLATENCIDLLNRMADNVLQRYEDYNYQILFGEFWKQLLTTHKEQVISKCFPDPSRSLFLKLLKTEDKVNINLIFNDATTLDTENIISSKRVKDICIKLIFTNKWNYLKVFVQACMSSKDPMINFKEDFEAYIRINRSQETLENERVMWNKCFQLFDDIIHEYKISECIKKLSQFKDEENIKLILEDATTLDREEIISSEEGKNICASYIYNDKLNLLKLFVQICISSKDTMIKFKEEFKEHIRTNRTKETLEKEKDKWNTCFQLLDDLIHEYNKTRSTEEGDSPDETHNS